MKLIFSLAVVSYKEQKLEDLLEPYIQEYCNDTLEECIKERKHFISGIKYGYFDDELTDTRTLILKNKNVDTYKAQIKDVDWQKIVKIENEELKSEGINIKTKGVDLEKRFGFTNSIITPDGCWHGMIPLDLITFGFSKEEPCKEYIKNYYTKYINPYEDNGYITLLGCNI